MHAVTLTVHRNTIAFLHGMLLCLSNLSNVLAAVFRRIPSIGTNVDLAENSHTFMFPSSSRCEYTTF